MNKFFELLRVNVSLGMSQLNLRRFSRGKGGRRSPAAVLLVIAVAFMVYFGWIADSLYRGLGPLRLGWLLVPMAFLFISFFILGTGIYSVNAVLFDGSDLDQLFSFPLRPLQILFAKVFALVVENWIIGAVIYLPIMAVYCYHETPGAAFYLFAILSFICLPFIPVCLFILIACLLNLVTSGARARNLINTVVILALIAGATFGIQHIVAGYRISAVNSAALIGQFQSFYPPLGDLTSGIVNGSAGDLLLGLLWNIAPFAVLCVALSFGYRALWSRSRAVRKTKRGKLSFGAGSPFSTLYKKELYRYGSSVMYILNSSIGMILMTLFAVLSGRGGKKLQMLEAYFPADLKILFVLLIFALALVLSNTTAASISLEGKNLWIIKSWPVDEGRILLAKLSLHLTVTIPLLMVDCVIAGFTMKLGVGNSVVLFVICALFSVLGGLAGLMINLYYHRFDFYNDTQVVKNSASVLLTYLAMAAVVAACGGIYWLWRAQIVLNGFLFGVTAALAVLTAAAAVFVFTKGKELFRGLS